MKIQKILLSTIILSSLAFIYACAGASPEYQRYQNQLNVQMQDMINVLNAGHYNQFIQTYVEPSYIQSRGGADKTLLQFDNKRQQALYKALTMAKGIQPLYNTESNEMTYIGERLTKPIVFKRINGKWYLESDYLK